MQMHMHDLDPNGQNIYIQIQTINAIKSNEK